jgi:ATP-binding protein involved in chromosome partitioning
MLRIAVPLAGGKFSGHFGGADAFAFVDADEKSGAVLGHRTEAAPPHEQGAYPTWLNSRGAGVVIAGGMGPRASQMLAAFGIAVVLGVREGEPESLARAYLAGNLASTGSLCESGGLHDCAH